jgi:Domain of unknown function (DUF6438)/Gram-negative bacterial TonB protein C-terminal
VKSRLWLLKNSCRGIAATKFVCKLLNVCSRLTLEFAEIMLWFLFQHARACLHQLITQYSCNPMRKKAHTIRTIASLLALSCCASVPPLHGQNRDTEKSLREAPIKVTVSEETEHFLAGTQLIRRADSWLHFGDGYVNLKIVVSPDGNVLSASAESGFQELYQAAMQLANAWKYVPFQRNGRPIYATFDERVELAPLERRPNEHVTFPDIRDWNSLRMTLRRTTCYGTCPAYTLSVFGDGSVLYSGDGFVRYCGEYRGHVSLELVRELFSFFKKTDYFNLFEKYSSNFTDSPTYTTSIVFDDKKMSVTDYVGIFAGMPEDVSKLENAFDRLAGPSVWSKATNVNGAINRPCHR